MIFVENVNLSLKLSLTALWLVGFWPPEHLSGRMKIMYYTYGVFSFMFLLGSYLVSQMVDMYQIWGDLPLMTGVSFLLFTNIAQAVKIVNLVGRRRLISNIINGADEALKNADGEEAIAIVKSCDRETILQQLIFSGVTLITMIGWATSAEKGKLPLRAWYPYDESKSPAFELTYLHQIGALYVVAFLNVSKDTLVTSLISQCQCRLQLLGLSLRTLCRDLQGIEKEVHTPTQEAVIRKRLECCVQQHDTALEAAQQLQHCFSEHIFVQFNVSLVIICVTAFQLVSVTGNPVRLISMATYLLNMMFQVFIYCYQGNQLSEESIKIADAAYECPWYNMSTSLKRTLLLIMIRSRRVAKITAGGFTTLSLASFMAIIKTSYSMFTLLQQLET